MSDKQEQPMWDGMKLLQPEVLRQNLLLASLYLSAFELLRSSIIDRIETFFWLGMVDDKGKHIIDNQYEEVKRLHKSLLQASCLWLQENGALSAEDVATVDAIRQHRNQVAHELPKFLIEANYEVNVQYLSDMQRLLRKIEVWWIRYFDLAVNPDFVGVCNAPHSSNHTFARVASNTLLDGVTRYTSARSRTLYEYDAT